MARNKKRELRNATDPTPRVWLVNPAGTASFVPCHKGTSNAIISIVDGRPVLRPYAEDAGWKVLAKECTPEELKAWVDYDARCKIDAPRGIRTPIPPNLPECLAIASRYKPPEAPKPAPPQGTSGRLGANVEEPPLETPKEKPQPVTPPPTAEPGAEVEATEG